MKINVDVETSQLYDTNETAVLLGISYATVFRWIKSGRLIPVRIGSRTLIPKSEVERLKEKQ